MLAKIDDFLLGVFSRICSFIRTRNAQKKKKRSQTPIEDIARRFAKATSIISCIITGEILFIPVAAPHPAILLMSGCMLYLHMQRNKFYYLTHIAIVIATKFPNEPKAATLISKHRIKSLGSLIIYVLTSVFVTIAINHTASTNIFSLRTTPDQWISSLIALPIVTNITNTTAMYFATFISGSTTTSKNPFAKARTSLLPALS